MLVALAWPSHIHHNAAHAWFSKNATAGWATCPLTQCGFIRISSNPKIISEAVSPTEALDALSQMTAHRNHVFWPDNISFSDLDTGISVLLAGHRQVTDAYLLGLAMHNHGRLATLDKSLLSLIKKGSPHRAALEIVQ